MRVKSINIENYKSVKQAHVGQFGAFNVLIGKNNSGKSNVLSAIEYFFDAMKTQNCVNLNPKIGKHVDFFQNSHENPVILSMLISLDDNERNDLLNKIVNDKPQMKNAVDMLEKALDIQVRVQFWPDPERYSIIEEISLVSATNSTTKSMLFKIGPEVALELKNRTKEVTALAETASAIRRFAHRPAERAWELKERFERENLTNERGIRDRQLTYSGISRRMYVDEVPMSIIPVVDEAFANSTSLSEFRAALNEHAESNDNTIKLISQRKLDNSVSTFSGSDYHVPNYAIDIISSIASLKILNLKERRKDIGQEEALRLLQMKNNRRGTQKWTSLQETISGLLGVKIDAFTSDNSSTSFKEANAELDVDEFLIEVNGTGIRESLRVVLDTEFEQPSILLVEEPEVHLHPALETGLMQYLRRSTKDRQIFITTHSTNFIDTANTQNVFLVKKEGETTIDQLEVGTEFDKIADQLGLRLSSLFMFDRIVFIEGPSDELVIREWAANLGVNLSKMNVGFVPMRGIGNFSHYAAKEILDFLTRRKVKMWFIIDRDERQEAELRALRERLGSSAKFISTSGRELENHLLSPRANIAYIAERKREASAAAFTPPTEEEFTIQINACADQLKHMAIYKYAASSLCRPIYPNRDGITDGADIDAIRAKLEGLLTEMKISAEQNIGKIEEALESARGTIEANWDSNKLLIVPGSELLDTWYKTHGLRFDKMRDSAKLAALMNENEIDRKLADTIKQIGS